MAEETKQKTVKADDVLGGEKKTHEAKAEHSSKKKKTRMKHTHIEHHYDHEGKSTGHTVRHVPEDGGKEVSYAAKDADELHDGLEEHVGEPNAGEEPASPPAEPAQPNPMAQPSPAPGSGV